MEMLSWVATIAALFLLVLLGAAPALLSARVPLWARLTVFMLVLIATIWITVFRADDRHGWHLVALLPVWLGMLVALVSLVVRRRALRHPPEGGAK
jgi:hypothetical protein